MSCELCRDFIHDLDKRDIEILRKWFDADSVLWIPPTGPVKGDRRILAMFKLIFRMYSEIHWEMTEVHGLGGTRFIFLTNSWGTLGDSVPYKNNIASIIEFKDNGKINFLSDYFKDTAIFTNTKSA